MLSFSVWILVLHFLLLTQSFAKTKGLTADIGSMRGVQQLDTKLLLRLLKSLKREENFETLYVEGCNNVMALKMDILLIKLAVPVVLLEKQNELYWRERYDNNILVIKCLEYSATDLTALAIKLHHMRQTRVIIYAKFTERNRVYLDQLQLIFKQCEQLQLLNVLLILEDFEQTKKYYAYEKFPQFRLTQRNMSLVGKTYFTNPLSNVMGYPLYTLPDQNRPRTIVYQNAKGQQQLTGYIGKLLQCFAKKLNATLKYPFPVQIGTNVSYIQNLMNFTRIGLLDIAMGLGGPKTLINPHEYSFTVEIAKWMVMLPVEAPLEINEMFLVMFTSRLFQIIFGLACILSVVLTLCNYWLLHTSQHANLNFWTLLLHQFDNSLRGVLGQAFPLPLAMVNRKMLLICILIFITGLLMCTSCGAYLNTFFTHQPNRVRINTFDELLHSNLKILMASQELDTLKVCRGLEFWKKYAPTFELITSWQEFLQRRSSLNTTYAYPVTTSLWYLIQKQQASFQRKLFRLSSEMWLEQVVHFSLPLQENSIYQQPFNWFIMQLHDAGLLQYWRYGTFYDMVANGMMSFKDLSTARSFHSIVLQDFYAIWLSFLCTMVFNLCVFIAEILIYDFKLRKQVRNTIRF